MIEQRRVTAFQWQKALRDDPTIDGDLIAVGAVLTTYADPGGDSCYPSQRTIAKGLVCSVRTVQRRTDALRDAGYLRVDRTNGGRNEYLMTVPTSATSVVGPEVVELRPATLMSSGSDTDVVSPATAMSPDLLSNHPIDRLPRPRRTEEVLQEASEVEDDGQKPNDEPVNDRLILVMNLACDDDIERARRHDWSAVLPLLAETIAIGWSDKLVADAVETALVSIGGKRRHSPVGFVRKALEVALKRANATRAEIRPAVRQFTPAEPVTADEKERAKDRIRQILETHFSPNEASG